MTEASRAGAAAAGAGDSCPSRHHPVHTHCQNCGAELHGSYCHACGQRDFDFHRSFGHVFLELLENFFHFDAKLFRDIIALLFRPGQLSAEFNAGKRAAQTPPFRLYLFVSVLYFFVRFLSIGPPDETSPAAVAAKPPELQAEAIREARNEIAATRTAAKPPESGGAENPRGNAETEAGDNAASRWMNEKARYAGAHQEELIESFFHALPKLLLVCLPFFAFYTRMLFRKTGYVYLQHLIVAVHCHTFFYLWSLVEQGWARLVGFWSPGVARSIDFFAFVWALLYPLFMLRRLFGGSWPRTILKTGLLGGVYLFTLGLGLLITAVIVFALA